MDRWFKWTPWLVAAVAAAVYAFTLCPSIDKIDAGELAAVQLTGGVAHPTGYPLFTLAGFLFSKIPMGIPKILQLNLLAMLYVTASVFFVCKTLLLLLPMLREQKVAGKSVKGKSDANRQADVSVIPSPFVWLGAMAGSLCYAFSLTVWEQATSTEVYSLQALVLSLIFFTTARALQEPDSTGRWIAVALAFGFSLANHITAGLLALSLIFIYFAVCGFTAASLRRSGFMIAAALGAVVLLYLWLPLSSGGDPAFNWGNIEDFRSFKYHITGGQFSSFLQGGENAEGAASAENLELFFSNLLQQWHVVVLLFSLFGFVLLCVYHWKLALWMALAFGVTVLWVIRYNIKDIGPYYLAAHLVIGLLAGVAIAFSDLGRIKKVSAGVQKAAFSVCAIGALACVGLLAGRNFSKADKSGLYFYEDYARAALQSLPPNAILVTYQFDWLVSPSYYLQAAEQFRPDVTIIDYQMFRNRPWYVNHIRRNFPEVYQKLQPDIDAFKEALTPFHYGEPFDGTLLGTTFPKIWFRLMDERSMGRPVYLGPELLNIELRQKREVGLPVGFDLVPELFFYRVVNEIQRQSYLPMKENPGRIRFSATEDPYYTGTIRTFLAELAALRARYEQQFQHPIQEQKWKARSEKIASGCMDC